MKLIVGLGNPGPEYARTRHNVGFMAVTRLAQRHGLADQKPRARFSGAVLDGDIKGQRVTLLQPVTFMNRSGQAVIEAVNFYKLTPADVLVIVDDTALPIGRIRIRPGGSAGAHNGLADIERALGTQQYARLRIGIDSPGRARQRDYVLGRFTEEQREPIAQAIERACDCAEAWLTDEMEAVMAKFNAAGEE